MMGNTLPESLKSLYRGDCPCCGGPMKTNGYFDYCWDSNEYLGRSYRQDWVCAWGEPQ